MDSIIKLDKVWKIYDMGSTKIYANKDVSMEIKKGEFVYIIGKSGSGKSTLLNMIGSLDYPSRGKIFLDNKNINDYSESDLAQLRGKKIGFVFQSFNLITSMTAIENVMLPMTFQNMDMESKIKRAKSLLDMVEMSHRYNNLPGELSGGERQRVAVARSLANDPEVIIADEPTGNLDSKTGKAVMKMFERINRDENKTIIIVTHDTDLVKRKSHHKVYKISDGELV